MYHSLVIGSGANPHDGSRVHGRVWLGREKDCKMEVGLSLE